MNRDSNKPNWLIANQELDSRFVAAMSSRNIEAVMSCFADSPDLVVVLWGTEMHGKAEVRQAIESVFNQCESLEGSIDRISRIHSGDKVFAVGRATYVMHTGGNVRTMREVWTDVRRQVNGKWIYELDHAEILPGT